MYEVSFRQKKGKLALSISDQDCRNMCPTWSYRHICVSTRNTCWEVGFTLAFLDKQTTDGITFHHSCLTFGVVQSPLLPGNGFTERSPFCLAAMPSSVTSYKSRSCSSCMINISHICAGIVITCRANSWVLGCVHCYLVYTRWFRSLLDNTIWKLLPYFDANAIIASWFHPVLAKHVHESFSAVAPDASGWYTCWGKMNRVTRGTTSGPACIHRRTCLRATDDMWIVLLHCQDAHATRSDNENIAMVFHKTHVGKNPIQVGCARSLVHPPLLGGTRGPDSSITSTYIILEVRGGRPVYMHQRAFVFA